MIRIRGKIAFFMILLSSLLSHALPVHDINDGSIYLNSPSTSTTLTSMEESFPIATMTAKEKFKIASVNLEREIQEAGINNESTAEDLHSKLSPILDKKYGNERTVTKLAYKIIQSKFNITKTTLESYKYIRNAIKHRIYDFKIRAGGTRTIKRSDQTYNRRKGTLPKIKQGAVNKLTESFRRARELEYQKLIQRIEEAGFKDATDPQVFLDNETLLKGPIHGTLRYGQILGEYMVRSRNDHQWYLSLVKARDVAKNRRARERKKALRAESKIESATTISSRIRPVNHPTIESTSPRQEYSRVESDPKQQGKDSQPTPQSSHEVEQSNLFDSIRNLHEKPNRPTTGVKRFRGSKMGIEEQEQERSEGSSSDDFLPRKRPTIAKKTFTGAGSSRIIPQAAELAPKRPKVGLKKFTGAKSSIPQYSQLTLKKTI